MIWNKIIRLNKGKIFMKIKKILHYNFWLITWVTLKRKYYTHKLTHTKIEKHALQDRHIYCILSKYFWTKWNKQRKKIMQGIPKMKILAMG